MSNWIYDGEDGISVRTKLNDLHDLVYDISGATLGSTSGISGSSGVSGSSGKSSSSGMSGTSGSSGTSGKSGSSGVDGTFFGTSGTSGVTGTSGETGTSGSSGISGSSGTGSTSGSSGVTGTSGSSGVDGTFYGSSGTSGKSGITQITEIILYTTGWSYVSDFYEYNYDNVLISSSSIVYIIPYNYSIDVIKNCEILPRTDSFDGYVKIYSTYVPSDNIVVDMTIM